MEAFGIIRRGSWPAASASSSSPSPSRRGAAAAGRARRGAGGAGGPAGGADFEPVAHRLEVRIAALEEGQAGLAARLDGAGGAEERLQATAGQLLGLIRDKNATLETALAGLDQLRGRMRTARADRRRRRGARPLRAARRAAGGWRSGPPALEAVGQRPGGRAPRAARRLHAQKGRGHRGGAGAARRRSRRGWQTVAAAARCASRRSTGSPSGSRRSRRREARWPSSATSWPGCTPRRMRRWRRCSIGCSRSRPGCRRWRATSRLPTGVRPAGGTAGCAGGGRQPGG